jgi:hypothetical protein
MGQDIIDQQRGTLSHPPGTTARADPTPFTTESHQILAMMVSFFSLVVILDYVKVLS